METVITMPDGRVLPRIAGGAPTLDEMRQRNEEIQARLQELNLAGQGRQFSDEERDEWNRLSQELTANEDAVEEGVAREAWLDKLSQRSANREAGAHFGVPAARSQTAREDIWDLTTIRSNFGSLEEQTAEAKDRAHRAVEEFRFPHPDVQSGRVPRERVQQYLDNLLETADTSDGALALQFLRAGSPLYKRAFGKMAMGQSLNNDETRALAVATGSTGGYAVPITLDPTLIPISNGVVNPMRAISRVETIVGLEYRGLTAGAVVASYAPEGTEASDNSPTIAQPDVYVERAQTFIPYSIEIGMDWTGLQANLARLITDAKDVLEGNKFTLGAGHTSSEPSGLLTGATSTVSAGGSSAFAIADLYSLEESLPPRFRPLAQFIGNRHVYNLVRQFGSSANQNLWMPIIRPDGGPLAQGLSNTGPNGDGNLSMRLLGYPTNEASDMTTQVFTGSKILALGDPNYYLIVDRIGMTVEFVPHLFGTNRRPTGQRGLYAYWRNTGTVVDPAGWRVLVTS
jgi:HK97 family phage major capsid protein